VHDAIAFYQRALSRWRRAGEDADDVAVVLNNLGFLRYLQGEPEAAQELFEEGLREAHETGNLRAGCGLEASIGGLLLASGDHEGGESAFRRALSSAEDIGELWTITIACEGLGLGALQAGATGAATSWFDRASSLAERQQSPYLAALIQADRALFELKRNQPALALQLLPEAESAFQRQTATRDLIRTDLIRALALARTGDRETACARFHDALSAAARLGLPGLLDLTATFDAQEFASLDAAEYNYVRDGVLKRIKAGRKATATIVSEPAATPLPQLRVTSFGRGEAWATADEAVDWGREKSRELFFYLLFDGPAPANRIMAKLWPETTPARARAGFDSAAYALRRRVHQDVLRTQRHQYGLAPDVVAHHDAAEFDSLIGQADKLADPEERASALDKAIRLYQGPLLEDTSGEWVEARRVEYENRALTALLNLAQIQAQREEWRTTLATAERALRIQPREDLFALAVRACVQLHDLASAKRFLRRWRRYAPAADGGTNVLFEALARQASRLAHFPT
jgi:DNA-binding SARP family transcriptional activator/Tfp pilus assembly protein PilF